MTELITHEVQVTSVDGRSRKQTDHLVQGNTSFHHSILVADLEVPVHVGINQAEDDGLVAHQCLVVAFAVRDGLFILAAVGHLPEQAGRFPVFIATFLDNLNPVIRNVHGHTVVETVPSVFERSSQSRHTRYFLSNGNGLRIHFMNQPVGQRQVANGIVILMTVEVVTIVAEGLTQSVAVIKHRSHPIETETVEMELFQPVFTVGQQEVNHLVLAIVKAERIPCRMLTTSALIEILARITGKVAQSFYLVLHGV